MTVIIPESGDGGTTDAAVALAAGAATEIARQAGEDADEAIVIAEDAAAVAESAALAAGSAEIAAWDVREEIAAVNSRLDELFAERQAPVLDTAVIDELAPEPVNAAPAEPAEEAAPKLKAKKAKGSGYGSKTWFGR